MTTSPIYFPCADCSQPFACKVLDGLCPDCYRSNVIKPLSDAVFAAESEYGTALNLVYKVEIALGRRPSPRKIDDDGDSRKTTNTARHATAKSITKSPDEDDFSV